MLTATAPVRPIEKARTFERRSVSPRRPPRPSWPAGRSGASARRPARCRPGGRPSSSPSARVRTLDAGAHDVRAWIWGEGPAILLVHGWGGRGAQLAAFVPPLVAAGHTVVAFDGPAHGDSPGRRATLLDFRDAIRAVADWLPGRSRGWSLTRSARRRRRSPCTRGSPVGRVVFLAPPADPAPFFRRFLGALGVAPALAPSIEATFERQTSFRWRDLVVPASPRRPPSRSSWCTTAATARCRGRTAPRSRRRGRARRWSPRRGSAIARCCATPRWSRASWTSWRGGRPASRFAPLDALERELFDREARWSTRTLR